MANLERVRFLVVDDNVHMLGIVRAILHSFGARDIVEAADAQAALEHLAREHIDIVIADMAMEVLDGIDLVRLIRTGQDSRNPFVPVIMLTANTQRSRVLAARDAGVTEFCAKPVRPAALMRKVAAIVDAPRPFVKTQAYFGPDRRRGPRDTHVFDDRRRSYAPPEKPARRR